jgi:protein phosphatase 1 regulatory subunit 7
MSSAEATPPEEHDPASANDIHIEAPEQEKKDHRPRDSKGWDGKLRIKKKGAGGDEASAGGQSEPEESEDEGPPPEQLAADEDLLDDVPDDEEDIDLVHCRISSIPALKLDRFKKLKVSGCCPVTRALMIDTRIAAMPPPEPNNHSRSP